MLRCRGGRASSSVFYKTKEKQEENWLPELSSIKNEEIVERKRGKLQTKNFSKNK